MRFAGCTVHFVRAEIDTGPIIAQAAVPVLPGDDAPTASPPACSRPSTALYPLALRLVAEGRVRVEGERTVVDAPGDPAALLPNPPG